MHLININLSLGYKTLRGNAENNLNALKQKCIPWEKVDFSSPIISETTETGPQGPKIIKITHSPKKLTADFSAQTDTNFNMSQLLHNIS